MYKLYSITFDILTLKFYMFYGAAYWEDRESETGHYAIENKKSPKSNIMHDSMWRISILTYFILIISN